MCKGAPTREIPAGRRLLRDGWVWAALGVTGASFTGLFLIHFLPPAPAQALEGWVHMTILCLYGPTMLACFLWPAIATVRRLYRARWQYSLRSLFIAVFVVAAFLGVAQAVGARLVGLLFLAALQLLTPVAVVGFDARSRSPWSAAALGAAAAWVSVLVYVALYALLFGITIGYPFPDAGPGLRGFPFIVVAFFGHLFSFKMLPVVAILLAGAIGGVVGWALRRRAKQCLWRPDRVRETARSHKEDML